MYIDLKAAILALKQNQVVAVPTETVYGLAGRISSEEALKLIFSTKQRPFFDPLIVHVKDKVQAESLVQEWSPLVDTLADAFWPGPLTLVIKKNSRISDLITSGLERVGLRCPGHPLALQVLEALGEPFAAPSANLFGRTSPTNAQHVETEFEGKVPVLDGGPCDIGIESTVLLVDQNKLAILRKGHIQTHDIEKVLMDKKLSFEWLNSVSKSQSPGHMQHHYMPSKPLFWVEGPLDSKLLLMQINQKIKNLPSEVEGVKLVVPKEIKTFRELKLPHNAAQAARLVYAELRRLSEESEDCLVFHKQPHHDSSDWEALLERLKKASSAIIHVLT